MDKLRPKVGALIVRPSSDRICHSPSRSDSACSCPLPGEARTRLGPEATQTLVIFDRTDAGRVMPWEEQLRREEHGNVVVRWL